MSDLMTAVETLMGRQAEFEEAERYYDGTMAEVFASPKMKKALAKTGTRFRINFAKTPVNSRLDRLEISNISSPDKKATAKIEEISNINELDLEAPELHKWVLVYGEAYLLAWPNDEGDVEVFYQSPRIMQVFYDVENPRKKSFAAKVWSIGDGKDAKIRVNLYYADRIEKYISKNGKPKKDGDFELYYDEYTVAEEDGENYKAGDVVPVWPLQNPFDDIPVFHFRTQRHCPRPEHKDAYGPQDMINKIVITQMAATDVQGFPQRYILANGSIGGSSDMTDFDDDSAGSEETVKLEGGAGSVWYLDGGEGKKYDVGQFDAADVDNFLKPLAVYIRAMAAVTDTPAYIFEGMSGTAPSGESRRAAEAPLIKRVGQLQALLGASWQDLFVFILRNLGMKAEVNVDWAAPQSMDDKEGWESAKAKRDAGVPQRQVLREAGYTDDEIDEFDEMLKEGNDLAKLEALSNIIQRLAAAVQLGLIDAEEARDILPLNLKVKLDEQTNQPSPDPTELDLNLDGAVDQ